MTSVQVMFESLYYSIGKMNLSHFKWAWVILNDLESFWMTLSHFEWPWVISRFENSDSSHDSLQLCLLLVSFITHLWRHDRICYKVVVVRRESLGVAWWEIIDKTVHKAQLVLALNRKMERKMKKEFISILEFAKELRKKYSHLSLKLYDYYY